VHGQIGLQFICPGNKNKGPGNKNKGLPLLGKPHFTTYDS